MKTNPGKSDAVAEALATLEKVQYVTVTTGSYDLFIRLAVESAERLGNSRTTHICPDDGQTTLTTLLFSHHLR